MPLFKFIAKYYIFFLCVNIFLPKIDLGFGSFYVFDFVNLFLFAIVLMAGKFRIHSTIATYVLLMAVSFVSFFVALFYYEVFDFPSFARLIKFVLLTFYFIIPYCILQHVSHHDVAKVLRWQFIFVFLAGVWVLFNMIVRPLPLYRYIWEYNYDYRLIGFTGYAIDFSGNLSMDGTTSVSMGVFVAFLFLSYLSFYKHSGNKRYLIPMAILLAFEMLTYSRAGVIVLLIGILYYSVLNLSPKFLLRTAFIGALLIACAFYFNLWPKISSFGSIGKIFKVERSADGSVNTRVDMLTTAYDHMKEHPASLIWGTGYGERYTSLSIGYPHLEGLVPTTLFTTGVFALVFLCLHFFFLWHAAKVTYIHSSTRYASFLYAIRLFTPGWFASALVAGNTFQTDFYFPAIYFIFFTSYLKETIPNKTYDQEQSAILQ